MAGTLVSVLVAVVGLALVWWSVRSADQPRATPKAPVPLKLATCAQLGPYFDGELAPGEVEPFMDHLLGCRKCRVELGELMQLDALKSRVRAS